MKQIKFFVLKEDSKLQLKGGILVEFDDESFFVIDLEDGTPYALEDVLIKTEYEDWVNLAPAATDNDGTLGNYNIVASA